MNHKEQTLKCLSVSVCVCVCEDICIQLFN